MLNAEFLIIPSHVEVVPKGMTCDMATDELVVKMNAALAPAKEQP